MQNIISKKDYYSKENEFANASIPYVDYLEYMQSKAEIENADEYVVWQTGGGEDAESDDEEGFEPCGDCMALDGQVFHYLAIPSPPHENCKCGTISLKYHTRLERLEAEIEKLEKKIERERRELQRKNYITSKYGKDRKLNIYNGQTKKHLGTDFGVPEKTPIPALKDGVVTKSDWQNTGDHKQGYGVRVEIKYNDGTYGTYGHLYENTAVEVGTVVKQGEIIGYSGNTGGSTNPHFHYNDWNYSHQETPPTQETLDYFNDYFTSFFGD